LAQHGRPAAPQAQAPLTQTPGVQSVDWPATQVPTPLQTPPAIAVFATHVGALQGVPAAYRSQLPAPSQAPSWPQVATLSVVH
jgi:hypothetical protein